MDIDPRPSHVPKPSSSKPAPSKCTPMSTDLSDDEWGGIGDIMLDEPSVPLPAKHTVSVKGFVGRPDGNHLMPFSTDLEDMRLATMEDVEELTRKSKPRLRAPKTEPKPMKAIKSKSDQRVDVASGADNDKSDDEEGLGENKKGSKTGYRGRSIMYCVDSSY